MDGGVTTTRRPAVLVVDDRPSTFTDHAFSREDVDIVLLRFPGHRDQHYLDRWKHLRTFDIRDGESLEEAAVRYRQFIEGTENPPQFFCNPHEPLQDRAQAFAALVGLPHLTEQQVRWVREKPAMKDRYSELGIAHAAYRYVRNADEVAAFAETHGWPVIVKPIDSFACIGTYRVERVEDVPTLERGSVYMVEEYVSGREFQLCALVVAGRVQAAFLSANPRPVLEVLDGAMNANITYSRSEPRPFDVHALCQRLVDAFEISFGYFHGECFVTPNGKVVMSEVAARISGCEVPENHGRAYGFDIHRAILDSYIGRVPDLHYSRDSAVGDLLLPTARGTLQHISPWHDLARFDGVTGGRIRVSVGDALDPPRASMASTGYVHVEGRDVDEVEQRMQQIVDAFELTVV